MSEVKALFGQFLKIQKEQNDLLKEIAGVENIRQYQEASIGLCLHVRDCHGSYWDSTLVVEEKKKTDAKLDSLNSQYKKNQERLEELYKQLFVEIL